MQNGWSKIDITIEKTERGYMHVNGNLKKSVSSGNKSILIIVANDRIAKENKICGCQE